MDSISYELHKANKALGTRRKQCGVNAPLSTDCPLPPARGNNARIEITPASIPPQDGTQAPRKPKDGREPRERVKTYPTINRAFLARDPHNHKRTLAAVGRLYYLLRAIDTQGAGKLALHEARELITHETGMTRRNLRGILRQGHGLTWRVADDCIYLSSPARVALALDCGSLRGRPVYIPIADLCEGIQQVRAAFFATYHGGRRETMPMTRQTIRALTGVPERTQQIYDRVAKTAVKTNIASAGELATKENRQRRAWENGRASFVFTDYRGVNFRKGAAVMAWRLPNSYDAIYEQAPKGRQRKHNQKINLVIKRQQGNDSAIVKTYHPTARIAARFAADDPGHDHYYPTGRALRIDTSKPPKLAGADLWRAIA